MANSDELTLSIGAATFLRPTRDVDLMVRRTDALMYRAKKTGKNRLEHELVVGEEKCPSAGWERRAVARLVCGGDVRVRAEWLDHAVDELARIVDISSVGIGLSLQQELPAETLLAIEPLHDCGVTTILARVVWCAQQMNAWHHGCILATPLEEAELQRWLRGVSDADGAPKAPVLVPEVGVFLEKF